MKHLLFGTLIALLSIGTASAQTVVNPSLSMTGALTPTSLNGITTNSVAVTVTVTDPVGINSIGIYEASTLRKTCATSPCAVTIAWTAGTTRHILSATASIKTGNQILTAQINYPN